MGKCQELEGCDGQSISITADLRGVIQDGVSSSYNIQSFDQLFEC